MILSNNKRKKDKRKLENQIEQIFSTEKDFDPVKEAVRIAGIYTGIGSIWILLSDEVLSRIVYNKEVITRIGQVKGWFFVLLTGLIIFGLVLTALRRIRQDGIKIDQSYRELAVTYEELEATYEELIASEDVLRQQYETLMEQQLQLKDSEERYLENQKKLHHIAYHDALTNLPNRLALIEDNQNLESGKGIGFGLLIVDVDNFKLMNDTLGHAFGDQLLVLISQRLDFLLSEKYNLYRLGGDEFVIITHHLTDQEEMIALASDILESFKEPIMLCDSVLHINVSMGVAVCPEHGSDINELLRCADIAMFKAKDMGRSRYLFYHNSMNEMMLERMLVEKNLRMGLEFNEFQLFYQPQIDIADNRISGFEALLRWNNRELGPVSPQKFIKIAEETHIIIPLGTWVLQEACAFMKRLQEQGITNITTSVNISIIQILQKNFVDLVLDTLREYNIKPQCLELEITETILIESYEAIVGKLKLLYEMGIKIALDDFGKGYSSLSYLKQLPITTLKIDKSFIDCITNDQRSKILTGQIVTMARSMGMKVVAEGVEDKKQLNYLMENQCQIIQGYLFSKPLPEREAIALLNKDNLWIQNLTFWR